MARILLIGDGHDVTTSTARNALALISLGARYNVVLCDLEMPDMSGRELHGALADAVPEQARRMVFMTACPCPCPPGDPRLGALVDRLVGSTSNLPWPARSGPRRSAR